MFLFPSPSTAPLLTLPTDKQRRESRTMAPFVPSAYPVVEGMLDLAAVQPDDVLIDLGCGDGRIVFEAARRGAQALGIDIDPVFVMENRRRASRDPDLARASFQCADMLTVDLSAATVVTCYLMGYSMELLQPKFETTLRPGTRIVSHAFTMRGWSPVRMTKPEGRLGSVYLWVV
jgi:SAM-dependent methyltransferase